MEARSVRLQDLDFDRKVVHVVRGKGNKNRYVSLSGHLIHVLKQHIDAERLKDWLFNDQPMGNRKGGDFESRNS